MCDAVGHPVEKLARVRFGPLALGELPLGAWRDLGPRELAALRAVGRAQRGGGAEARDGDSRAARHAAQKTRDRSRDRHQQAERVARRPAARQERGDSRVVRDQRPRS